MPDFLSQIVQNLSAMNTRKKMAILGALAAAIAAIFAIFLWLQKPKMELLYSNLSMEDIQAIEGQLKRENISYQLSSDKTAIFIPDEKVHEARLKLAAEGLPGGAGVGFEIFDRTTIGVTEFVQNLNYRRALEGELARTIASLSPVRKARVHITIPKKTLFSDTQEKSRASVTVSLRAGKRLSDNQLQGISHLVASSVEGLDPRSITIVDGNGRMLSRPEETDVKMLASNSHMEYKHNYEKNLEQKLQSMLDQVVGQDKATVRVASSLNFDEIEHMEEKFDPEVQVPRSEQTGEEKTTNFSESTEAPPGVAANLPAGAQPEPAKVTTQSENVKNDGVTNYEINKTTTRRIEEMGALKQLSVAVIVDGTYQIGPDAAGVNKRNYVARTPEEMLKLEAIVKNAIGFSEDRGDQVSVINIPFETGEADAGNGFRLDDWLPLIRYGVGLLLVLFLFFFIIRPIMKSLLYVPPQPLPEELTQATPKPMLDEEAEGEEGLGGILETVPPEPLLPPLPLPVQVLELAREDPKAAADLLKNILQETR